MLLLFAESNDIPNLPPIFRDSLDIPKETHYLQGHSTTSEPLVGHIQNEYTPSSKHSPNELPSKQDKDSSGFPSLVLVVGGCILLLVLTITLIVFMVGWKKLMVFKILHSADIIKFVVTSIH